MLATMLFKFNYIFGSFKSLINVFGKYYTNFLEGLGITLLLSLITVLVAAVFGFLICLLTMSKIKTLRFIGTAYVEIIRGIPLLLQLTLIILLMPNTMSDFIGVCIALIINSSAYVSEIIRSGIQAVDKGQYEASRSLGMSSSKTMLLVILPQAIKNFLPAIGNEYVTVIKETSLASVIFLGELMTVQKQIGNISLNYLETFIIAGVLYFISTFTLSKVIRKIEKRMKYSD